MKILVFNCMFLIVRQTLNEYLSRVSLHRLHISFIIVSACISFRWTWIVGFIKHLVSLFLSLLLHMSSVTISVSRWSVCCISLEHWAMIRRTIVAIQLWIGWAMIKKHHFLSFRFSDSCWGNTIVDRWSDTRKAVAGWLLVWSQLGRDATAPPLFTDLILTWWIDVASEIESMWMT